MNLINELKQKSNEAYNVKQEVIREIKDYFNEYLNSDDFENYLRTHIDKEEIEKRETSLIVEFWEYHIGCSDTYFYCGGKRWNNPEVQYSYDSRKYKEVMLCDIQSDVCQYLETKLIHRMKELGFNYLRQDKVGNRFNYFDTRYYFGW